MTKTLKQAHIESHPLQELKDFRNVSDQIMHLAFHGLLRIDFLKEASRILMEFCGCDSVEMWLKERGKYYLSEMMRSKKQPFRFKIIPVVKDRNGQYIPKLKKDSYLDQLCLNILLKRYDSSLPFMTDKGIFWTADTEKSLALLFKKISGVSPIRSMKFGGYRSLVVVPIAVENKNIGLLQLKKKAPDSLQKKDVLFCEKVVQTLGIASAHRRTQVELRERVKELTCLYGIAKLAERADLLLEEILQGIVQLLPPAWLYPEITAARITVDQKSYSTGRFQNWAHRQMVSIIVEGHDRGTVEVIYSEKKPELDEGPFLKEERNLIDTVAKEVALIIERKQTEQDKEKLQEQLRHADRLATIGQLSAGVAHELNEPIGSILGFAQLVQKYPGLSEQVKQDTEKIMKASLHAREVVKKLMLFARQMPPQKTQVNLNQIVEESLYFLESRCAKEGIKVIRNLSQDMPEITADPAQITQVFVNITVNAIQAMPNGGKLTIKTESSDKTIFFIVEDTGVGMDEGVIKKIFLPFFTTKDIGKGTGLGLPVVHGIVTSHGGSIDVKSKEGQGTRFEVRLPVDESKEKSKKLR
jgi:signal transduction histidine kinase